jgi:hypothetical protein
LSALALRRAGTRVVGVAGGNGFGPQLFRFDDGSAAPLSLASGTPGSASVVFTGADMSPDTAKAIAAFLDASVATLPGLAFRSTNGGRAYVPIALGGGFVPTLFGAGFVNATDALLLGDSSTIIRVNVTTGVATRLGAAQGIPQPVRDAATGALTTYRWTRTSFAPDGTSGWVTGTVIRRVPGQPDIQQGVILQTTDGGQTFAQQGISGAASNGLAFPRVADVQARAGTSAFLAGDQGLVAARTGTPVPVGACSFRP